MNVKLPILIISCVLAAGLGSKAGAQTSATRSYLNVNDPWFLSLTDSLTAAGAYDELFNAYYEAGVSTTASGATRSAAYYYYKADKIATEHNLTDKLAKVLDAEWRLSERRGMVNEAFNFLKRSAALQQSTQKQRAQVAHETEREQSVIEPEQAEEHEQGASEGRRGLQNRGGISLYIIVAALALLLVCVALLYSARQRKSARQIARLVRNNAETMKSPFRLAQMASSVSAAAEELAKASRKESFDARRDILPVLCESNRLSLAASNLIAVGTQRLTAENKDTDLDKILKSVAKEFDPEARLKEVRLEYKSTGKTVVSTDGDMVKLAISNMVSNGVNYAGKGKTVSLWIETVGSTVTLGVEDNGAGMDPAVAEDAAMSPENERMGLGISVCRKIADSLGAKFSIKSLPGKGTTVTLIFK